MSDGDLLPTAVYRLFSTEGGLLYVGMGDGFTRIKAHLRKKPWRAEIDPTRTQVEWFGTRAEAARQETQAIRTEAPRYNIAGTSRAHALGHTAYRRKHGGVEPKPFKTRHFVGAGEIGDRLGVSRQRVQQLIAKPDFPAPYDEIQMGKVWRIADIEAWIREHRPALADSEPAPTATPTRKGPRKPPS
ncbi:putative regulatory protein [Actinoplanes missouriensis 431]|uniref:Putative regulatory protein n=1 Tax=Actinoplanes missouriensis (strain ATCC 14538 / DSM 43046 / CBS 188.64 / JCM 3121 / NBRC 102363 / NCIMB 12654 / NRRL B-3342 / UNCC 431) TaxID=512565 RepID=I0H2W0_ACTM4|nr:putative regulatory protein [Actinoplanes missouriensis 431]